MSSQSIIEAIPLTQQCQNDYDSEDRFACNICFESVKVPVVTRCGHLYCWSCLYIWLEPGMNSEERRYLDSSYFQLGSQTVNEARRLCPVCKAPCNVKELVPIYVRESRVQRQQQENSKIDAEGSNEAKVDQNDNSNEEKFDIRDDEREASSSQEDDEDDGETSNTQVDVNVDIRNENVSTPGNQTGLRRRRTQMREEQSTTSTNHDVPSRPLPPPSRTNDESSSSRAELVNNGNTTVLSNAGHSPALALHQSLFQALVAIQTTRSPPMANSQLDSPTRRSNIPSLHNRNSNTTHGIPNPNQNQVADDENIQDAASEFLSRLLLMLGCFVILCLLLF